jgi:hypothetical protein
LRPPGDNFAGDGGQAVFDGAQFGGGEDADFFQHGGVGQGAEDVVFPEPPIKGNGLGESDDVGVRPAGEASAARNWKSGFHVTGWSLFPMGGKVTRQLDVETEFCRRNNRAMIFLDFYFDWV